MLTFEDWAKGCGYNNDHICFYHEGWLTERSECPSEDRYCACPRLEEYTADVEADAYESHLLDKGDDARDREEV